MFGSGWSWERLARWRERANTVWRIGPGAGQTLTRAVPGASPRPENRLTTEFFDTRALARTLCWSSCWQRPARLPRRGAGLARNGAGPHPIALAGPPVDD